MMLDLEMMDIRLSATELAQIKENLFANYDQYLTANNNEAIGKTMSLYAAHDRGIWSIDGFAHDLFFSYAADPADLVDAFMHHDEYNGDQLILVYKGYTFTTNSSVFTLSLLNVKI